MTSHPKRGLIFFVAVMALTAISGVGIYLYVTSPTDKVSREGDDRAPGTDDNPRIDGGPVEEKSTATQGAPDSKAPSRSLLGTWSKVRTQQEDHQYPPDSVWNLSVTFGEDGRFVWNSKRYENSQDPTDESLEGTYLIERGFLVTYRFDKPSPAAQQRLPELFAFWPKKMLGQQTFKFRDDSLILGHDGAKLWIHLKRKTSAGEDAAADTDEPRR